MTLVGTFSAALTSGIVFGLPTSDSMNCNSCNLLRILLSIGFLFFTFSLLSAFLVQIGVRTWPRWSLRLNLVILSASAVSFSMGFLIDAICLIIVGQKEIGTCIIILTIVFIAIALFQFLR